LRFLIGAVITASAYWVIYETRPIGEARGGDNVAQSYARLLAQPRFTALVLQTGFSTGTFMILGSAASTLMKELLGRPATEFGIYFVLLPIGFISGTLISSRPGNRASTEAMVLIGSLLCLAAVAIQSVLLLSGHVTPLAFFRPGLFVTMAQGIALPYAQAGAKATIPRLAATAAGIGVFVQQFCGGVFAQLYGLVADGTPAPMVATTLLSAVLGVIAGAVAYGLSRAPRQDAERAAR
jgi:DHA1 family bicyclomycin/chloramphenicol resistance-like MFS transporter